MENEKIIECVTEEKAIEMLKLFRSEFDVNSNLPNAMMFDVAIRAIEENEELKASIERLNYLMDKMMEEHEMFPNLDECTTIMLKEEIKRRRKSDR